MRAEPGERPASLGAPGGFWRPQDVHRAALAMAPHRLLGLRVRPRSRTRPREASRQPPARHDLVPACWRLCRQLLLRFARTQMWSGSVSFLLAAGRATAGCSRQGLLSGAVEQQGLSVLGCLLRCCARGAAGTKCLAAAEFGAQIPLEESAAHPPLPSTPVCVRE